MISISNLTKSFGDRDLFKNISLGINRGEKIGLVGPNGAGKSTLFSIILGESEASSGESLINKSVRVGYLPQEAVFKTDSTVLSELLEGDAAIKKLVKEKEDLEHQHKADNPRYGEVLGDLEFMGYFELEHKAKKILSGLGFKVSDFKRKVNTLSGGWQMRTLLAKLLTCPYDVLFLDEPMNHLDLNAALWFKDYLTGFKGTFMMISHDKDFLNDVTNYTLVLEHGTLTKIKGNYSDYEKMRNERIVLLQRQFNEQEKKRQQLKVFMQRFHAQPNKAAQVRAKKKQLEKMPKIIIPLNRQKGLRGFSFPQGRSSGYRVLNLEKISKSYGDIEVYKDFDFEIIQGEKAVLAGANGAGKSTLLKIMADVVKVDKGKRVLGSRVDVGYFSQTRMDILNEYSTVFNEVYSACGGKLTGEQIRTLLGAFLFSGDDVDKKVTILSGGEKSRLILAKLLADPPNFLLLDEPTTHLDVDAVDALIRALNEYKGTLIFISHDIHFVRSVANCVYEVKQGAVKKYPGNFDYYLRRLKGEEKEPTDESVKSQSHQGKKHKGKAFLERQDKKKRQTHNNKISKQIRSLRQEEEKLDLEKNVKVRMLSNPRSHHNKDVVMDIGIRLKEIESRLSQINSEIKTLKKQFQD